MRNDWVEGLFHVSLYTTPANIPICHSSFLGPAEVFHGIFVV